LFGSPPRLALNDRKVHDYVGPLEYHIAGGHGGLDVRRERRVRGVAPTFQVTITTDQGGL
jgi:hypothetical protein